MPKMSQSLPGYTGPYSVGTIDIEVPVERKAYGTATLKHSHGQPALLIETVLMTLYYPCDTPKGKTKHMYWLERPLRQTARGYAKLISKPSWLVLTALWLIGRNVRVPAHRDVPLASCSTPPVSAATTASSATSSATQVDSNSPPIRRKWPTVIFSHGLSGVRTTYSQYCGELASRGYVVAAVEHRDGSGPITVVRQEGGKEREVLYLTMDDLEFLPPHKKLSQMDFRREQLDMRLAEVEHVVALLHSINDGRGDEVRERNRRNHEGVNLRGFADQLDLEDNFAMSGHSFGGATTLQILRAGKSRFRFTRGVTLDPWVDPIPTSTTLQRTRSSSSRPAHDDAQVVGTDIVDPLLVINSEAFTLWTDHFRQVRSIVRGVRRDAESWFLTLVGSIHISFSDFPIVAPYLVGRYGGTRVDPVQAVNSFVETTDEFLSGRGKHGEVLGREVIDGDEENKRPGEPPMQAPGELRLHLRPKL